LAPGGRTTSRAMSNPLLSSYSSCFVFTKHHVQLKTVTTCFQNMFFSKRAPKQKGGCLDTPWIRHCCTSPIYHDHSVFYPRDAMLARVLAMALCLSVSVRHNRCSVKTDGRVELVPGTDASFDLSYTVL